MTVSPILCSVTLIQVNIYISLNMRFTEPSRNTALLCQCFSFSTSILLRYFQWHKSTTTTTTTSTTPATIATTTPKTTSTAATTTTTTTTTSTTTTTTTTTAGAAAAATTTSINRPPLPSLLLSLLAYYC